MADRLKKRLASEESGFTLIELLVVIIILGILLAIAVPAYISIQDKAAKTAAQAQIRTVLPDINQYLVDNNNSYTGITVAGLKLSYDASLNAANVDASSSASNTFYVCSKVKGMYSEQVGPDGTIADGVSAKASLPSGGGSCSL